MIATSTGNGVAMIQIARPEKKNALTAAMYRSMADAVSAAVADPGVRSLLITGQPGVFTAGNDLEDFMQRPPTGEDAPAFRFMRALIDCDKPVVAAVTGVAVGIGTTMLLHCDLVYVSEDAHLSMPFVALGLVPEFASSFLLPRLLGGAAAAEYVLLGEPFTGAHAVTLGIANAALPAGEVLLFARQMAERLASWPPEAMRATKRLLRAGTRAAVDQSLRDESAVFVERLRSPEAKAAFEAFLQRRRPPGSRLR